MAFCGRQYLYVSTPTKITLLRNFRLDFMNCDVLNRSATQSHYSMVNGYCCHCNTLLRWERCSI